MMGLMRERRSEDRYMCSDLVKVLIAGAERTANLEDISPSGACLQTEMEAPVGAEIEILCRDCRFKGLVRYCRFVDTGFDVGVQFARRAWDPSVYQPEHLLEVPMKRVEGPA